MHCPVTVPRLVLTYSCTLLCEGTGILFATRLLIYLVRHLASGTLELMARTKFTKHRFGRLGGMMCRHSGTPPRLASQMFLRNGREMPHLAVQIMMLILLAALLMKVIPLLLKWEMLGPTVTLLRLMWLQSLVDMAGRVLSSPRLGPGNLWLRGWLAVMCMTVLQVSCLIGNGTQVTNGESSRLMGPFRVHPGTMRMLRWADRQMVLVPWVVL